MMNVGVIGFGYWGPNIVRNFNANKELKVTKICDMQDKNLEKAKSQYPEVELSKDFRMITAATDVDIVAIVTPVFTHFEIARDALLNGKHIFIEKPFTSTAAQAEELINIAERKNRIIMVDHTFLFTSSVKKIKQLVQDNELGRILYFDSTRINLGLFQHDINVVWDLAPHDLSIMNYLFNSEPEAVAAHGIDHFGRKLHNIAYLTAYFKDNMIAHFNLNWLSPVKVRYTLIGGNKKMLLWNDLESDEKIKIYDKGVDVSTTDGVYNLLVAYRSGDMYSPKLEPIEALKVETNYFVESIKGNVKPFNDGEAGLKVVKLLEAFDKSLTSEGKVVRV
ncbi:MAG: Gfo/Idh/MocA family oxidoreductase [Oligoflexia bacterium]|nr:Gfo/Idh/MocA family oxidoreductase [Oligoflexia bacterium]